MRFGDRRASGRGSARGFGASVGGFSTCGGAGGAAETAGAGCGAGAAAGGAVAVGEPPPAARQGDREAVGDAERGLLRQEQRQGDGETGDAEVAGERDEHGGRQAPVEALTLGDQPVEGLVHRRFSSGSAYTKPMRSIPARLITSTTRITSP